VPRARGQDAQPVGWVGRERGEGQAAGAQRQPRGVSGGAQPAAGHAGGGRRRVLHLRRGRPAPGEHDAGQHGRRLQHRLRARLALGWSVSCAAEVAMCAGTPSASASRSQRCAPSVRTQQPLC
jgi:hypothetical protein